VKVTKHKVKSGLKITYEVSDEECKSLAKTGVLKMLPNIIIASLLTEAIKVGEGKK
jgi:hypothetical protein